MRALRASLLFIVLFQSRTAAAYTVVAKVVKTEFSSIIIAVGAEKTQYRLSFNAIGCDLSTRTALAPDTTVLFYRNTELYVSDPMVFDSTNISDPAALFLAGTGEGVGAPNGKCELTKSRRVISDSKGCCSSHLGIDNCAFGRVQCVDGAFSTSCTCDPLLWGR
jgi:hypothetical protein